MIRMRGLLKLDRQFPSLSLYTCKDASYFLKEKKKSLVSIICKIFLSALTFLNMIL